MFFTRFCIDSLFFEKGALEWDTAESYQRDKSFVKKIKFANVVRTEELR